MKKLLSIVMLALGLLASSATAQVVAAPNGDPQANQAGGRFFASHYNYMATVRNGNAAAGAGTLNFDYGLFALQSGKNYAAFSVTSPITVGVGSTAETVTPTGVSGCGGTADQGSSNFPNPACQVSATFSFAHALYGTLVQSGTFGFCEAVNDALSYGGGIVVIDKSFGGTTATITGAPCLTPSVMVEDLRAGLPQYFYLRPTTLTTISAPSVPTLSNSTTGGTWTAGAVFGKAIYVDYLGGVSLASADTSDSTTTTTSTSTITIASPASTAGAVGWLPCLTAVGGGSGNEVCYRSTVTAANCTLSTLVNVVPACAIGSAYTSLAPSTSLDKVPDVATAHTAFAWQPFSSVPALGIQTTYGPFSTVATVTSTAATIAAVYIPAGQANNAGVMNFLNKELDFCVNVAGTEAATAVPTFTLLAANQYGQSPVTLATIAFATQTGAVTWDGCYSIQTAAVGSSGTFWAKTLGPIGQSLNGTQSTSQAEVQVTTAASSTLNLSQGFWLYLQLASATANTTNVTVNNLSLRVPAS